MVGRIRYIIFVVMMFVTLFAIIPVCILRPFSPKNNGSFFKIFIFLMRVFGGFRLHFEGVDTLYKNRPAVMIGNHQHNYDMLVLGGLFKTGFSIVLGKAELGKIPVFGQIFILTGNLLVKRGDRKKALASMAELEKKIKERKLSVLVFPEGHRNPKQEMLPFKKGAFYTAVRTQAPIIPFAVSQYVIKGELSKFKVIDIYLKVLDPIPTTGLSTKDIPVLIEKSRSAIERGISELNQKYYNM